jgi:glutamyl-tRNA reductase
VFSHYCSIAFTHRNLDVSHIGSLHIEKDFQQERFTQVKAALQIDEVLFLSTCNRVEFHLVSSFKIEQADLLLFFSTLYPDFSSDTVDFFVQQAEVYENEEAVMHLLRVASSIDSLVVGEREIITQVRGAFEQSKSLGLSGDFIRILIRHTIETAKKVYTETKISLKPVSVVSIAYQRLLGMNVPKTSKVLVVGTGVTNTAMVRFLKKYGLTDFTFYNRSIHNAEALAQEIGGTAHLLSDLPKHSGGFDILVSCTSAQETVISSELYGKLLAGDSQAKVTIDLALPSDLDENIHANFATKQISIQSLQKTADLHLQERSQEIDSVEAILNEALENFKQLAKLRKVEIAMREVPAIVKEIRSDAFNAVFKAEIEQLDGPAKATLQKVLDYVEKKYMAVPMKMAKEILIQN